MKSICDIKDTLHTKVIGFIFIGLQVSEEERCSSKSPGTPQLQVHYVNITTQDSIYILYLDEGIGDSARSVGGVFDY